MAANENSPPQALLQLAHDPVPAARLASAQNPSCHDAALAVLGADCEIAVRQAACRHAAMTPETALALAHNENQHHGHYHGAVRVQPHGLGEQRAEVSGQHIKLPVGEIDNAHDPHDQGDAQGRQGIGGAHHHAVGQVEQQVFHGCGYPSIRLGIENRGPQAGPRSGLRAVRLAL